MIQINDLRIGNKILDPFNNIVEVAQIKPNEIGLTNGSGGTQFSFSPIPLFPVVLEKSGFEDIFGGYYKLGEFGIDYSGVNNTYKIGGNNKTLYIDYVHQLQNLYFCVMGQELPINL